MKPTLFDTIQHRLTLVWCCSALVWHDLARLLNYVALNVESGWTNTKLYRTNIEYMLNVIQHRLTPVYTFSYTIELKQSTLFHTVKKTTLAQKIKKNMLILNQLCSVTFWWKLELFYALQYTHVLIHIDLN